MENETWQAVGGVNRRAILRTGLLAGIGAATLAIGSGALTGSARASADSEGYQIWDHCSKCQGLFYGAQESSSICPASGTHNDSGSYQYQIFYDYPAAPNLQSSWAWCDQCRGLFYGPDQSKSVCPAGGPHSKAGSYDYSLGYDDPASSGVQINWNYCSQCRGLFYGPKQSISVCPVGGQATHEGSGSYSYCLNYV